MLEILAIVLMFFLMLRVAGQLYGLNITLSYLKKFDRKNYEKSQANRYLILVPVFNEFDNILKIEKEFQSLAYPKNKYKIIFITTEKEKKIKDSKTIEIVKKVILRNKSIPMSRIHYPFTYGRKAEQLNHACRMFDKDKFGNDVFVLVLDADCKVDKDCLKIASYTSEKYQKTNVFVGVASYFRNYKESSFFVKPFAFYQTMWSFGMEYANFLTHAKKLHYIVGHNLFIRFNFLKSKNYFPEPIEDVPFGYELVLSREPIGVLPIMSDVDIGKNLKKQILQTALWFKGSLNISCRWKQIPVKYRKMWFSNSIMIFRRVFEILAWAFESDVLILLIILSFAFHRSYLALILIFFWIFYSSYYVVVTFLYRYNLGIDKNDITLAGPLITSVFWFWTFSFGPQYCLLTLLSDKIKGK